ncbi:hypothetical protein GCM10023085_74420 [Actinomadura viridis]
MLLPGWHCEAREHGLVAQRLGPLTDYQLLNGCLPEIAATNESELWLLRDAQARLAERVAVAEAVRTRS